MIFQGNTITAFLGQHGIATMAFDAKGKSVNTFDLDTIEELREAVASLAASNQVKGLIVMSKKPTFVVGADIKQFHALFANEEAEIVEAVVNFNGIFSALEDLPFPTLAAINGMCLGGGYELALACDYRVACYEAKVGLPEVKLGINPGFGGTIRLPRLIGVDNSIEWIATGNEYSADAALKVGAVDAVVDKSILEKTAVQMVQSAIHDELDYQKRREEKKSAVKLSDMERLMAFTTAKGLVAAQAGPHMPAPTTAVRSIEKNAGLGREAAIEIEAKYFAHLAKTEVSSNLVALFLNQQDLSKRTDHITELADSVEHVAVLGAGIMGGGIAYQAGYKGKSVLMKDVAQQGLDMGMEEAAKLLSKRVDRGRMTPQAMANVLAHITPTLHYAGFEQTQIVVEAVIENLQIKKSVLSEVEQHVGPEAIIASNTSTMSITQLADGLKRPENFCGMHFFNPVHRMPLVEVIRGEKTSQKTIAKVVKLAKEMGKTPIVVNDCAGFFVNRVLFPYLAGFNLLLEDGVDFVRIDKVMERFGWPMGPAYLCDVVGLDTACHAAAVMAEAFPDRMKGEGKSAVSILHNFGRNGQKNNEGFYRYETDKKGKPKKLYDEKVGDLLKPVLKRMRTVEDEEIIERMMLPMCFEVIRCLDEGIVESPVDADMGVLMGVGFPLFRGGVVKYMESVGLKEILAMADNYQNLGELYRAPMSLIRRAEAGQSFFEQDVEAAQ